MNGENWCFTRKIVVTLWRVGCIAFFFFFFLLLVGYLQSQKKHFQQKQRGVVLLILSSSLWTFGWPQTLISNVVDQEVAHFLDPGIQILKNNLFCLKPTILGDVSIVKNVFICYGALVIKWIHKRGYIRGYSF